MITIVTGIPGMGKSALIVKMMMEEQERARKARDWSDRPFFVMGIPELKLDHSPVPPIAEWTEQRPSPEDPTLLLSYFTFPKNSIVVLDEAQRVYRARSAGSKVPDIVAAFETHRHTGVDFWLLTQKPLLLDNNIRELCGRHIHIRPTIFGRMLYEWQEFADPKSKADREIASKRKFSPPKTAFNQYKSSELHTKQKFRVNNVWYFLLASIFLFAYLGTNVYKNISGKLNPVTTAEAKADPQQIPPTHKILPDGKLARNDHADPSGQTTPTKPDEVKVIVHPFLGYKFIIRGTIETKKGGTLAYFDLVAPDGLSTFVSSKDLESLGYGIKIATACSAFLFFDGAQIVATCSPLPSNGQGGAVARDGMPIAPNVTHS